MADELTRWEYCFFIKQTEMYMMMELSDAGKDGWELVSISFNKDLKNVWNWTAFLKRPIGPWSEGPGVKATTVNLGALRTPAGMAASEGPREPTPEEAEGMKGFDLGDGDFGFKEEG